jgi:hypothetical protein
MKYYSKFINPCISSLNSKHYKITSLHPYLSSIFKLQPFFIGEVLPKSEIKIWKTLKRFFLKIWKVIFRCFNCENFDKKFPDFYIW